MLIGVAVMLIIMGTEFVPGGKSKKKHSDAESPSIGDYESILEDKLTDLLASVSERAGQRYGYFGQNGRICLHMAKAKKRR